MHSKRLVDYSDLFQLTDPFNNRPLRLSPRGQDWIAEDTVLQLFRGQWQPPEPVLLKAAMGGQPADFLWTTFKPLACVSQRVVDLLGENNFRGWGTYPVEVYGKKGERLAGYYGFAVKSWAGVRDLSRSEVVEKPAHFAGGPNPRVYRGIFFDESQWDGSDFFRVSLLPGPGSGYTVVTRRVRDAFRRAKVTNVVFIPLPEHEQDVRDFA